MGSLWVGLEHPRKIEPKEEDDGEEEGFSLTKAALKDIKEPEERNFKDFKSRGIVIYIKRV